MHVCMYVKGVGNFPEITSKMSFLRYAYSPGESVRHDRRIILVQAAYRNFILQCPVAQCMYVCEGIG